MSNDKIDPAEFANRPTRATTNQTLPAGNPIDDLRAAPTRLPGQDAASSDKTQPVVQDNQRTQMFRPGAVAGANTTAQAAPSATTNAPLAEGELIVGWLVVIKGAGKGNSLALGYGWNTVGRGGDQRVRIDFGDMEISRENHCSITYDGKNRKFYVQHGGGKNLTYLGDQPVLAPAELHNMMDISLGNTVLRFVSFCDAKFDWADL